MTGGVLSRTHCIRTPSMLMLRRSQDQNAVPEHNGLEAGKMEVEENSEVNDLSS